MVTLTLTDFVIPPDDVPEDVRARSSTGRNGSTIGPSIGTTRATRFTTNGRRSARERQQAGLDREPHEYPEPGEYRIVVKVIDILGNDTTKTVKVKVKSERVARRARKKSADPRPRPPPRCST